MKNFTDTNLISLLKADDNGAFAELVNRYWERLYIHIYQKIRDKDEAKDMVQDIFLSLWKNRSTITTMENGGIAPYLFKSAKYAVISHFSRPGILVRQEEDADTYKHHVSNTHTDSSYLLKELQSLVEEEVSSLPERLQLPYRLSREQELSIKEIALKLCISEQTVKNNISTVLQKIRLRLSQYNSEHTALFILFFTGISITHI